MPEGRWLLRHAPPDVVSQVVTLRNPPLVLSACAQAGHEAGHADDQGLENRVWHQ